MTATSLHPVRDDEYPDPPELVVARSTVDLDAASRAVHDLLIALGQDPTSEHLVDTPRRVAAAFAESLTPTPFVMTTFANDDDYDEMVVVRDITFHSLCAHHIRDASRPRNASRSPSPTTCRRRWTRSASP